ncbi:low density lipoprotein receptor adapter protein 1-B-like [Centruroides vittatus]|uniref:low density lipoprotein receptor adapter protein 1-B-like n=1 Tax=Centruroides vittatus TaxID=120091 RepID=UPI0035103F59
MGDINSEKFVVRFSDVSGAEPNAGNGSRQVNVQESLKHGRSSMSASEKDEVSSNSIPQTFVVKYLGKRDSKGLWGIKHTRKPVDQMVKIAKTLKNGETLPFLKLEVSLRGISISEMPQNRNRNFVSGLVPIETISYGVQDLVYTRVFAMIVVCECKNETGRHPFECHGFVCGSRQNATSLTLCLAEAFKEFSKMQTLSRRIKKFAIDLRPEESNGDGENNHLEDSEA